MSKLVWKVKEKGHKLHQMLSLGFTSPTQAISQEVQVG